MSKFSSRIQQKNRHWEKKKYLPYSCHHNQKSNAFLAYSWKICISSFVSTSDLLVVGSKPGLTILFSIFFHKSITFLQGKNPKCRYLIMNIFYEQKSLSNIFCLHTSYSPKMKNFLGNNTVLYYFQEKDPPHLNAVQRVKNNGLFFIKSWDYNKNRLVTCFVSIRHTPQKWRIFLKIKQYCIISKKKIPPPTWMRSKE